MVHFNKTKEANAVENIFCKPMDKIKIVPMTETQSDVMINIFSSPVTMLGEVLKSIVLGGLWYAPTFKTRIEALGYKVDPGVEIFVNLGLSKSVGDVVMWANFLAYKAKVSGVTNIRFREEICQNWFPEGFPDLQEVSRIWMFQKVHTGRNIGSDNLLDYPEAAKTIRAGYKLHTLN